ncbi:HSP20-like chaperone [Gautieria morchelliformis]|nr:HSP20-like chaperone [Gautieria morchelliformis]
MALSTYFYEPFHEPFFTLSDFDRLFDAAWDSRSPQRAVSRADAAGSPAVSDRLLRPKMDLHESKDKDEMTATFELPGMKKEDINIDVHNNRLVVSGQSNISDELNQDGYAVRERRYGKFSRTLPLPPGIKPEDIKANMDNGVLSVRFPKSHPDQEPKKVTVS